MILAVQYMKVLLILPIHIKLDSSVRRQRRTGDIQEEIEKTKTKFVVWFIVLKLTVSRSVLDNFTVDNVQESFRNFSEWLVFITLKLICFP